MKQDTFGLMSERRRRDQNTGLSNGLMVRSKPMRKRDELKREKAVYPPAEHISDEEFRRRLTTIDEWREREFAAFKKEHPDYFKDQD
jgi:hypothetical protein